MAWTPLSRHELDAMIAEGLAHYDDAVRSDWERIRIEPEKWRCSPWGDDGGGFWAVAVEGDQVHWYNDIEGGFNVSPFTRRGTIGAYQCSQSEFTHVLAPFAFAHSERVWTSTDLRDVPDELRGPGTVVGHYTTYWELQADAGARYRAFFRDEDAPDGVALFATAEYPGVELLARHPLLAHHEEPQQSLYFSGTPIDPRRIARTLERVVGDVTEGWRNLGHYAGSVDNVTRLLRSSHGLLMRAPTSVCAVAAAALEDAGIRTSTIAAGRERPRKRLLLLGRSYVIAGDLVFERR